MLDVPDDFIALSNLFFKVEIGKMASLVENGKLLGWDRFERFGQASPEQCVDILDRLARCVDTIQRDPEGFMRDLDMRDGRTPFELNGFSAGELSEIISSGEGPFGASEGLPAALPVNRSAKKGSGRGNSLEKDTPHPLREVLLKAQSMTDRPLSWKSVHVQLCALAALTPPFGPLLDFENGVFTYNEWSEQLGDYRVGASNNAAVYKMFQRMVKAKKDKALLSLVVRSGT